MWPQKVHIASKRPFKTFCHQNITFILKSYIRCLETSMSWICTYSHDEIHQMICQKARKSIIVKHHWLLRRKLKTFVVHGQTTSEQGQVLHTIVRNIFLAKKQKLVIELSNLFQVGIMILREWNRFRNRISLLFTDLKHFWTPATIRQDHYNIGSNKCVLCIS